MFAVTIRRRIGMPVAVALVVGLTFAAGSTPAMAETLESRSDGFDAAVDALDLASPVAATALTGAWDALPGGSALEVPSAEAPVEDEQVVVLTEEGGAQASGVLSLTRAAASEEPPGAAPSPVTVDLGGIDVTVAPAEGVEAPAAVRLRVAGEAETAEAGITGVLIDVTDASQAQTETPEVVLTVSYASFAGMVAGDWASRLRFVWVPDCGSVVEACVPTAIETVNDPDTQTVTATVPVLPGESIEPATFVRASFRTPSLATTGETSGGSLAITAGASGSQGDWGATSLAPSSTWGAAGATGAFTWSLPIGVPSAAAGPTPQLGLSYSSAASDGRTPSTNNQSGVVGEGFTVTEGYVERSYTSCSRDDEGAANNVDRVSGDLCWGAENATMMFNGTSIELVRDETTGRWHPKAEDGSVVERVTGASWNTGQANEYWRLTTTDGTQYYFGRGKVSSAGPALNSAWTTRVYGNHAGEACYHAEFSDSACNQVWRWNLDYVVDVSGNSMTYFYDTETNRYVYDVVDNTSRASVSYVSGGHVDRIEYGTRAGSENPGSSPAKVVFDYDPRCITNLAVSDSFCSDAQSSTSANHWLDTPTDLICTSATAGDCENYSPVFFDLTRLNSVSTFTYDGSGYRPLDTWSFGQTFEGEGPGVDLAYATNVTLVLRSVTHTGKGGTTSTADDITGNPFVFGYDFLANRITTSDLAWPLVRPRMIGIRTDSGAQVSVNYTTECAPGDVPGTSDSAQAANTRLCFPVKWYPGESGSALTEYFHKWVVTSYVESGSAPVSGGATELITGSLAKVTTFAYTGGASWAKPTGAMVKADEVTYSDFRGLATVTTTLGEGADATSSRVTYYRGTGSTLTAGPAGDQVTTLDREEFRGQAFVSTTLNGTIPVSETVTTYGTPVVTATSAADIEATRVPTQTTDAFTYDAAGLLDQHTREIQTFDVNSQVISTNSQGDVTTTSDDTCTSQIYAAASDSTLAGKNLVALVAETRVVSVRCETSPSLPGDLIAASVSTFDDWGRVETVERVDPVDGEGMVVVSRVLDYDDLGRPLQTADALGNVTTTSYLQSAGGLTSTVTKTGPDPDGWGPLSGFQVVTHLDPITGLVASTADANGLVTSSTYDALGRVLTVRQPEQQGSTLPTIEYQYVVEPNGLNAVATKTLGADGASQQVSVVLYDGLLRVFQTQSPGRDAGDDHDASADGRGRVVTHTYYDSAGRVAHKTGDWWATGAPSLTPVVPIAVPPSSTSYEYDAAGRVVAEIFWIGTESNPANERWRTVSVYDGTTTLVIPPLGGTPQATIVDARGQVVERIQYLRDPDEDAAADTLAEVLALPHQSTTYEFDGAGLMVEMHDPVGNDWAYDYDWGGRLVEADDPDGGALVTTYDAADRVLSRTNGNGETLAYTYDVLGRMTSLRDDDANGALRAQWAYDASEDESGDTVLGQLSSSTRFVDGQAYTTTIDRYDDAYRTMETTFTLPDSADYNDTLESRSFTTKYTYTSDGQIASVALPAIIAESGAKVLGAETVTTRFDTASVASWMSGGFGWGTYVAQSRVTADAQVSALDLGNTYGAYLTYDYETGTERLSNISLARQGRGLELSLDYGYDAAGNVTSIFDQSHALPAEQDNQCFGYDGLSQLEVAWSSVSGDCAVAQSALTTAHVGGVSPYWTEYQYDAIGNRTGMVEHGVGASSTIVTSYTHGGPGFGPHQIRQIVATVGGVATTTSLTYDDAGNRESATTGGDTTTFGWDAEGELTGVDDDEYVYDASGSRIVRSDESGTTLYLPGGQEVLISPEGDVSATRYYSFSGLTVAVRHGRGLSGVDSLVLDHQDTVVASVPNTDWSVGSVQVVRTDPFGGVRDGSNEGVPGDRGFLGLTHDASSGLSLLGARYYDSVTGTFLSVDPLLDPATPAQFNAYVYGWNNPVTCPDPSGQRPAPETSSSGAPKKKSQHAKPAQFDLWGTLGQWVKDIVQPIAANKPYLDFALDPGDGIWWFNMWGWDRSNDGNYHASQSGWQQYAGYGDWMDFVFGTVTDIAPPEKYEFEYEGETLVFWAWKGDYLVLGGGAELGLYRKGAKEGELNPEWNVDKDLALPMTMTLDYRDQRVASYTPDQDQWWCTTWVPTLQNVDPEGLLATYTVDFSDNHDMFDAFRASDSGQSGDWIFHDDYTATLKYRRKRKAGAR